MRKDRQTSPGTLTSARSGNGADSNETLAARPDSPGGLERGTIVVLNEKGFGFIRPHAPDDGGAGASNSAADDLFFFQSELENISFRQLQLYTAVDFRRSRNDRGPGAVNVRVQRG